MSRYFLTLRNAEKPIDFAPKTIQEEVQQCLFMILTTWLNSAVLYRSFGIDSSIIDQPPEVAKAAITSQIFDLVEQFEPRAVIERVRFVSTDKELSEGKFIPELTYGIQEVDTDVPGGTA